MGNKRVQVQCLTAGTPSIVAPVLIRDRTREIRADHWWLKFRSFASEMLTHEANTEWNDLLQKAKAGKSEARDEIFRELSVKLVLVAQYRLIGWSRQDQEDLVQESLFILLQKLNRIESNPHLYAYKILHNKIGDALRRP